MTAGPNLTNSTSNLPTRAQVVIIGGGVIGCSLAYHLPKLGWKDVLLLEQTQLTAGTTWHAAGLIVSGFETETTMHMAKYTRDLYEKLGEETGQETGFKPIGYLQPATNPNRLDSLRRRARFRTWIWRHDRRDISGRGKENVAVV